MSEDQPFYAPNRVATQTRTTRPREHLWAIRRTGRQYDCEVIDHGTWGIEVRMLRDLEWFYGHRRASRELAVAEGEERKAQYLREGGIDDGVMNTRAANDGSSPCRSST